MSHIPKITLIGIYKYDPNLFVGLELPEGVDKTMFIDSLMLKYGECPILYTSNTMMHSAIELWSKKWVESFTRIKRALDEEYNPLHNYDRYEQYDDTTNTEGTTKSENKVSAYNSSTYQPDNYGEDKSTVSGKLVHNAHLFGNIGLTTSQQMALAEIDFRSVNNIYDIMSDVFRRELLLYIF